MLVCLHSMITREPISLDIEVSPRPKLCQSVAPDTLCLFRVLYVYIGKLGPYTEFNRRNDAIRELPTTPRGKK